MPFRFAGACIDIMSPEIIAVEAPEVIETVPAVDAFVYVIEPIDDPFNFISNTVLDIGAVTQSAPFPV